MTLRSLSNRTPWLPWVTAIAGFWLSGTLVLDFLVMPMLYVSGMMTQSGFAAAGYSLFWTFNRLELLCAAALVTGFLALRRQPQERRVIISSSGCRWALGIALMLGVLGLVDTYGLTPTMSALGLSLDSLAEVTTVSTAMNWMHGLYWLLEAGKLLGLGILVWLCYQDFQPDSQSGAIEVLS